LDGEETALGGEASYAFNAVVTTPSGGFFAIGWLLRYTTKKQKSLAISHLSRSFRHNTYFFWSLPKKGCFLCCRIVHLPPPVFFLSRCYTTV
jgi:hypothetical protein